MSSPGRLRQAWRNVRPYVVAVPVYYLASWIGRSLKIESRGFDRVAPGGRIFALWHGRTFMGATFFRGRGCWTIISHSKDGDMQNTIFRRFGFQTIRGSTGRGGVKAAIETVRVLRKGGELAFTPDGPRGPSGIVQEGLVLMARKSGVPVYPVAIGCAKRWLMKSWDRYMIPKPFSKAVVVFGEPLTLTDDASPEDQEAFRLELQNRMHALEREVEAEFGHPSPDWHKA